MGTISDFTSTVEKLSISRSTVPIGNGDAVVDGATTFVGPGGFATTVELVIVAGSIAGSRRTEAAAIGSASRAYAAGDTVLFTVDSGVNLALILFDALDDGAAMESGELTLLATLTGTWLTAPGNSVWGS